MSKSSGIPELLGGGIYSPSEVSRLVGLTPSRIRRWIQGYRFTYETKEGRRRSASGPVVQSDLPRVKNLLALSFLELIEVYVVGAFLQRGVRMSTVRLASRRGMEKFGTPHPFANRRFKTDGRWIFVELEEEATQEKLLLELSRLQYAMPEILNEYLDAIEFDAGTDLAVQWWPQGREAPIVLDPRVAFGSPVIAGTRIPVQTISDAFRAGETVESLGYWYNLTGEEVQAAINFANWKHAA